MGCMRVYKHVENSKTAELDIYNIALFLFYVMSDEGARNYLQAMRQEMKLLAYYADIYQDSDSVMIKNIHPEARRMLSHNKKWNYIFHIEDEIVVVDRILASSTISK